MSSQPYSPKSSSNPPRLPEELPGDGEVAGVEEIEGDGRFVLDQREPELPPLLPHVLHEPGPEILPGPRGIPDCHHPVRSLFNAAAGPQMLHQKIGLGNRVVPQKDQPVSTSPPHAQVPRRPLLAVLLVEVDQWDRIPPRHPPNPIGRVVRGPVVHHDHLIGNAVPRIGLGVLEAPSAGPAPPTSAPGSGPGCRLE